MILFVTGIVVGTIIGFAVAATIGAGIEQKDYEE